MVFKRIHFIANVVRKPLVNMTKQLTETDRETILKTPFLRVDRIFYSAQRGVLVIVLFLVLLAPSLGPKVKPPDWEPPKTLEDYVTRLVPYLVIWLLFTIAPLTDFIIRTQELKAGTKKIKELTVTKKWTSKRWTVLLFEPFHISIFRYFFRLRNLNKGDMVVAELSSLGRIIDFKKID